MTTEEKIKYFLDNRNKETLDQLANNLGWKNKSSLLRFLTKHNVRSKHGIAVKNRCKLCEIYYVHKNIQHKAIKTIAAEINRNYGFIVNNYKKYYGVDLKGSELSQQRKSKGLFKKGITPHNKGLKCTEWMTPEGIERQKENRFKAGQLPHNNKPIGHEVYWENVGWLVKQEDLSWKLKSHLIWEKLKGYKIDKGFGVGYKDGNKRNCDPENLFLKQAKHTFYNYNDYSEINEVEYFISRINKVLA